MKLIYFIYLLIIATCATESAKILGVFHIPSYSHYILGNTLLKELAAKGHEVTMISAFEQKPPVKNYRTILLEETVEHTKNNEQNVLKLQELNILGMLKMMGNFSYTASDYTLKSKNVQKLLKSNEKFDLIIMEQFMNEALRGFQYHYNVPCIIFSTIGANSWVNPLVGNPENPAYVRETMSAFTGKSLSLFQRMQNTFLYLTSRLIQEFYIYRIQNELMHQYFPDAPYVTDFLYNTSFILLNSHPSYSQVKPLLPNMIEVGGMHITPTSKLPEDLQKFLDDAKDGAIYFSLGGNVKSKYLPDEKKNDILDVFSKLKMKVLWKFEDDSLKNIPGNVKISKWFPQQEILAHPNVKLFITHGGLLSTIETIHHGKPVIGIPLVGDQKMNMQNAVNNGYGIKLDYEDLTKENFANAINEVISNKAYAMKAKELSELLHDQQVKPLDRAVYWVEYVLRHKGARHLRSNGLDLEWYQLYLLDVLLIVIAALTLVYLTLRAAIRKICTKKTKKVTQTKVTQSKVTSKKITPKKKKN